MTLGLGDLHARQFGRLRPPTFVRRRGTSCMLPRSRAGEKLGRATFFRKTQWFQHTFPLSSESGPGGSREILGGSRGPLDVPPGLSGGVPWSLPGCFLQDSYSEIPPQENLPEDSLCRIPFPGFHFWNSSLRSPHSGFLFQDYSCRVLRAGFLF